MASLDESSAGEISSIPGQLAEDLVHLVDLLNTSRILVSEMQDLVASAQLLVEGKQLKELSKVLKDFEDDGRESVVDAKQMLLLVKRHLEKPQA